MQSNKNLRRWAAITAPFFTTTPYLKKLSRLLDIHRRLLFFLPSLKKWKILWKSNESLNVCKSWPWLLIFIPLHELVLEVGLREWQRSRCALHFLRIFLFLIHNPCKPNIIISLFKKSYHFQPLTTFSQLIVTWRMELAIYWGEFLIPSNSTRFCSLAVMVAACLFLICSSSSSSKPCFDCMTIHPYKQILSNIALICNIGVKVPPPHIWFTLVYSR